MILQHAILINQINFNIHFDKGPTTKEKGKKMSKSVSGYFKTKNKKQKKKFLMTTKPKGGGIKALVVRTTKKRTFFAASLTHTLYTTLRCNGN